MRVAVLTSGGDAPGMTAAVRAVVRTGVARGWAVLGVRRGYAGLLAGDLRALGARDVGGIIGQAGTLLGTARSAAFRTEQGQHTALGVLHEHRIEGLVVIGGDGSQAGALVLSRLGLPVVGIPATIDNDLVGTDLNIGSDTALNVAVEAIDRLRITAAAHERAFLVEVMGRQSGFLALLAGLVGGAEAVVLPEAETDAEQVAMTLHAAHARGKGHAIVVVGEGGRHNAEALAAHFRAHQARLGFEVRVTQLGYVLRGGVPTAADRLLATRLGAAATASLARGETGVLVGLVGGATLATPFADVVGRTRALDEELLELAHVLSL